MPILILHAHLRIECHYFKNHGFLESDGWPLITSIGSDISPRISCRGATICCPPVLPGIFIGPEAEFIVCPDSGHSVTEPGIRDALIALRILWLPNAASSNRCPWVCKTASVCLYLSSSSCTGQA